MTVKLKHKAERGILKTTIMLRAVCIHHATFAISGVRQWAIPNVENGSQKAKKKCSFFFFLQPE